MRHRLPLPPEPRYPLPAHHEHASKVNGVTPGVSREGIDHPVVSFSDDGTDVLGNAALRPGGCFRGQM